MNVITTKIRIIIEGVAAGVAVSGLEERGQE
ncbi:hypothetical protein FB461_1463 [Rarobacter faecitabidus]|uniref:Uncharacterized protein n=1 Tax=Rarobacter faecitabidus TaxID=13243 RepID=A0A542ZX52_RARFA|nr:hypothetical protein FB461_1463 [Rarobacter faecitabidus]